MTPTVCFRKLRPTATIPSHAHDGDAGMDLTAVEGVSIPPGECALVPTGLAMELPPDTEAQVRPRSGLALKHQVTVLNSPGTIDQGYRGEVAVILINHGKAAFLIEPGMRVAQLVIKPILRVNIAEGEQLSATSRGEGGFGSSGV